MSAILWQMWVCALVPHICPPLADVGLLTLLLSLFLLLFYRPTRATESPLPRIPRHESNPQENPMPTSILKQPSAWLPIALSLAALTLVLAHLAIFGTAREADEGTTAHLFQILMIAQTIAVAFFAIKWLPRNPRQASPVLALQISAALAALAPVFYFNL
jgi:hypothetical protein